MATNNLLTQPTPHYHKFVDNQVLTDDQLNDMLDYLNHQDRLSRMLLHGIGVVCGLQISLDKPKGEISLSDGVAVTTAGDLLKPGAQKFTGFKKFSDSNVKYSFFMDDGEEGATMDLWELETDTSPSDVKSLNQFESTTDIEFDKAVAILYLEDYLGEEEDCSPVDCDTQGRPVINRLRVLLVSRKNARKIAEGDSIFSNLLISGSDPFVNELPKKYVPRVLLNQANTGSFDPFKNAYDVSFSTLAGYISKLGSVSIFKKIFEDAGVDPVSRLHDVPAKATNFQYVYDFYHDIANAYNELRDLLKKNYALCCPDPEAFPKHVLLGSLVNSESDWRHPFYPSPTHVESAVENMSRVFRRILHMIRSFRADEKNEIRITPSRDDDFTLGKRAVPFYYDLEKSENASDFIKNWKEADIEWVPNYYGKNYPGGSFNPLNVHLDDHDFYRIEGHTGKHISDAHKKIREIQKNKNLPFDIQQVAIGDFPDESTIDYDKYRVYFEDLQVVLQAWNEEQQCLMKTASDFLTKFSTKEPGTHASYARKEDETNTDPNINTNINLVEMEAPVEWMATHYMYGSTPQKKTSKAKENQVIKSISTEKDTLGYVMKDVVKTTDNKNDIWVKTNHAVGNIITNWDPDIVEATVKIPGQLIGYLKETEDYKLTDIEDFTEENLRKYLESLKSQCRKTKDSKRKLQSLIDKESSAIRSKEWTENYLYILNRITSSCCIIEKVKVLYEKIIERKKELLNKFVLDQFIENHPGAEHKAGVERGGTFVLLYYSKSREKESRKPIEFGERFVSPVIDRERFLQPISGRRITVEFGGMTHFPGSFEEGRTVRRTGEEFVFDIPELRRRGSIPRRENIPHGTVVGDLCLPYICCSETPSTNFVFPEQLATLRIPVDHVCVDENGNSDPVPLNVTPSGGTVKAFIQKREIANAIIENENGTFFDPNRISPEDYGSTIRFEVNGQPVEPMLEVYHKPNARFTINEQITFRERNTIAVVTFQNRSTPFDELTFEWDFGDDVVANEDAIEFTHSYKVEPGENYDFNVKLTAFNGPCESSFSQDVNIDVPQLDVPDNPDQPDDPDQPDQPDEPVENCLELTHMSYKASFNGLERVMRDMDDELDREFRSMYLQQIRPMYERVQENIDLIKNNRFNSQASRMIEQVQKTVLNRVHNQRTSKQQFFMLLVYYEMALYYFYMHSCQDKEIRGKITRHDRQNNWVTFTKMATQELEEAMKLLFDFVKIHNKFDLVQRRMQDRFDEHMADAFENTIQILKEFNARR